MYAYIHIYAYIYVCVSGEESIEMLVPQLD